MQRESDLLVRKAIEKHNMIFLSAQHDRQYFHWQVELYMYQFAKHGIIDRCYTVFGYDGDKPSQQVLELAKKYPTIKYYKDNRKKKTYIPTIRPYLLTMFFKEYPELGKNVFYHDSDILIVKLPRFDLMLNDNIAYLSDTIWYIGYEYIKGCCKRYKEKHPQLREDHLFYEMCKSVNIDPLIVKNNHENSGGAQYLLKNIDSKFWETCETDCNNLYDLMCEYEKKYPIDHHVQKWTADMWAVLWGYWKRGDGSICHKELDFSWATSDVKDYYKFNIHHLAGVMESTKHDKLYKSNFQGTSPMDEYYKDKKVFDNVSHRSASYEYVEMIKEYYKNVYLPEKGLCDDKDIAIFRAIVIDGPWTDIYYRDNTKICCGKPIWRSDNKEYIIFNNKSIWICTYSKYESDIGEKCGGIAANGAEYPYINKWNTEVIIKFLS